MMTEGPLRYLMMAALVAIHLGLALVLGSVVSRLWLRADPSEWRSRTERQARSIHVLGLSLGSLGLLAAVWLQAAAMADDGFGVSLGPIGMLLGRTHFGHAWIVGLLGWLAAGSLLTDVLRRNRQILGLAGLGVFVFSRSVVSHAGAQGDFTLDVAVDWVHLVLVCLWVGIVAVGAIQRLPGADSAVTDREGAIRWVSLMSDYATVAIVGIGATGLFKVWHGLTLAGSIGAYLNSTYGYALLAKLGLVAAAACFGAYNKFIVMPRLFKSLAAAEGDAATWGRSLSAALRLEMVVLASVLFVAALLSSTESPVAGQVVVVAPEHMSHPYSPA